MADQYSFKTQFEPIFLPGETAKLITETTQANVECVAVGALPEYVKNFGALTALTWSNDNQDTNLEMTTWELAQLRMRILDDFKLVFNNLSPTRQWRTAKTDFYLRQWPQQTGEDFLKEFLFKVSEFFIFEDDTPRFNLYSDMGTTKSTIVFSGWRFRVKQTTAVPKTIIRVSGWPSGG